MRKSNADVLYIVIIMWLVAAATEAGGNALAREVECLSHLGVLLVSPVQHPLVAFDPYACRHSLAFTRNNSASYTGMNKDAYVNHRHIGERITRVQCPLPSFI